MMPPKKPYRPQNEENFFKGYLPRMLSIYLEKVIYLTPKIYTSDSVSIHICSLR